MSEETPGLLALVGGQEFTPGCSFDEVLIQRTQPRQVHLLATAAAFERPELAIASATSWLTPLGVEVAPIDIYERADALEERKAAALASAEFVYLAGGSPFHLRSVLKDTPALAALERAWRQGATVAASSAGAMALCDPMVDPRGGALTLGLGLVRHLAVIPHAEQWSPEAMARTIALVQPPTLLVAIDARTAVLMGKTVEVLGAGRARVYEHGVEVGLDRLERAR
jgi:cyanophycinase